MGMIGEEITDDRVWIVKSHHPLPGIGEIPEHRKYTSNKVICCVRNPLDAFYSSM
jgi:hypothetical protein